uniref:Uncharacterized protein n=1 Tax=Aegilops tauschii TaxID=37682 RepID=M8D2M4_AEGTA
MPPDERREAWRLSSATDDSLDGCSMRSADRVKVRQYGKTCKKLTGMFMTQELATHSGSVWCINFSLAGRYLASAGEDRVIHVWEVSEGERKGELLGEDPECVFGFRDKPFCSPLGHAADVLDLSWSKSQISNVVEKVPFLKGAGAPWLTDLTTPDALCIFPMITSLFVMLPFEAQTAWSSSSPASSTPSDSDPLPLPLPLHLCKNMFFVSLNIVFENWAIFESMKSTRTVKHHEIFIRNAECVVLFTDLEDEAREIRRPLGSIGCHRFHPPPMTARLVALALSDILHLSREVIIFFED